MKRRSFLVHFIVILFVCASCLVSCSSTSLFSLQDTQQSQLSVGIMTGTINYGSGFYFPSSSDILDISLLKTDGITGIITEVSHQRIRNIQRFPLQFTVRYDMSDISDSDSCRLLVSLTIDGQTKASSMTELISDNGMISDTELTIFAN